MNNKLVIIDIHAMLHPRTILKAGADFFGGQTGAGREEISGLPVGGIREVLQRTLIRLRDQIPVYWCFDTRSDKKLNHPEYKSGRVFRGDVLVQANILKDMARRLDIPYFYREGFEADDGIAAAVVGNIPNYYTIDVYTGDKRDLGACILNDNITLIGTTAEELTVNRHNYEAVLRQGVIIPYNTLLPFNTFLGKPSNTLGVLKLPSKVKAKDLFFDYRDTCDKHSILESQRSRRDVFDFWISDAYKRQLITREDASVIYERAELCFPRPLDPDTCKVPFYTYAMMDAKEISRVLHLFQMYETLRFLGLDFHQGELPKDDSMYLFQQRASFLQGTLHVDNKIPIRADASMDFTHAFEIEDGV